MKKSSLLTIPLALLLALASLHAAPKAAVDETAKLRDALRNSLLQARDLQNQVATLQAQDAEKALTIEDLTSKLEQTQKRLADDKTMADRAIALLQEQVEKFETEIGELKVALDKWKASHREASSLGQKTEMLRSKLAREKVELERIVADQRSKNHEMYKAAVEILDRYKNHALGDAILAREPFVGNMRAKIQQLSHDIADRLADQRIKPETPVPPTSQTTATN